MTPLRRRLAEYHDSWSLGLQETTDWTKAAVTVDKIAFNQGALQAYRALGVRVLPEGLLQKLPLDGVWPWLSKPSFAAHVDPQRRAMLALELMQISMRFLKVDKALDDPDIPSSRRLSSENISGRLLVTEGRHGHFAMRWKECCARSHVSHGDGLL